MNTSAAALRAELFSAKAQHEAWEAANPVAAAADRKRRAAIVAEEFAAKQRKATADAKDRADRRAEKKAVTYVGAGEPEVCTECWTAHRGDCF